MLDFAGNVGRLGPITLPRVHASSREDAASEPAPLKVCPACDSYIARDATRCEHCGYAYPEPARKIECNLDEVDPLYARPLPVEAVTYRAHHKPGRPASLRISYRLPDRWLSEWMPLFHGGVAGRLAAQEWRSRGGGDPPSSIAEAVRTAQVRLRQPTAVRITEQSGFAKPVPVWDATS